MWDGVEVPFDVDIQHPPHALRHERRAKIVQSVMRRPAWPKAIRAGQEVLLIDGLQQHDDRPLRHLVLEGRNAERPLRAIRFGDVAAAHRRSLVAARLDAVEEVEKVRLQRLRILGRRDPVDARRPILAGGPIGFQHPVQVEDVVQRGERPVAVRPRHVGYPSPCRGQVCGTQSSLPCFPSMGLSSWRLPFLPRVPASPVPRAQRYYEGATTSRARMPRSLWLRFWAPHASPCFVLAVALPRWRRTTIGPGVFGEPGSPVRHAASGPARDLSGFLAIRPTPLPCSKTPAGPTRPRHRGLVDAAPGPNTPKAPAGHDIGATPGLRCPLPTLHERRCRRPCKARFRLVGCTFAGRELNPLDRSERFQVTSILLPRTFLTQVRPDLDTRFGKAVSAQQVMRARPVLSIT